jgi:hypothetical protein
MLKSSGCQASTEAYSRQCGRLLLRHQCETNVLLTLFAGNEQNSLSIHDLQDRDIRVRRAFFVVIAIVAWRLVDAWRDTVSLVHERHLAECTPPSGVP